MLHKQSIVINISTNVSGIRVLTVLVVTFGIAHVETGSLHVGRQHVPPFILVTQHRLGTCRALCTRWHTHTHTRKDHIKAV